MNVEQVEQAGEDERLTDNCCYRSGALVTGVHAPVAGIDVDGHQLDNVTALYRARFRYQA